MMITRKKQKTVFLAGMLLLGLVLFQAFPGVPASAVSAEEIPQEGKHLVIKVVEDEGLLEIEDYEVPLSSFSEKTQEQKAGIRHIILMSAMLACVIIFVLYQGVNEKKLISLRRRAALSQSRMMTENRKL